MKGKIITKTAEYTFRKLKSGEILIISSVDTIRNRNQYFTISDVETLFCNTAKLLKRSDVKEMIISGKILFRKDAL